jgi:hypothetical protein
MQNKAWFPLAAQLVSGLRWHRTTDGIIILNANLTKKLVVKGVEADLWEWVSQGFSGQKIIEMISNLCNLDYAESEKYIKKTIQKLGRQGLLEFSNKNK